MFFLRFLLIIFFSVSLNALSLTKNEKEWIQKNPNIKVGVDENWPPFDFIDENKSHKGLSSEYLNKIASLTGLNFEIYSNKWSNVLIKIKNKELDILACAANTEDRKEYLSFTQPYIKADIVAISRKDVNLNKFDDIKKLTVAVPKGNFVHEQLKTKFPKIKFLFVKTNEEAIRAVSYGRAEVYIGNLPVGTYYINKYFLTNLEVKFNTDLESAKLSIAVLKDKEILFSILQKALLLISEKEKKELNKKWIFDFTEKPKYQKNKLDLTIKEIAWLNKNMSIKVAGDIHANPFSFLNDKGKYVGIIPDIIKLIKDKTGLSFEYVPTKSWTESLLFMKKGKVDILDYATFTKDRSDYMNFTTLFLSTDYVVIGRSKDNKYINTIEKIINKYKIATVQDDVIAEMVKKDYPGIVNFREYENIQDGLKAVSVQQIDFFLTDIPTFEYYSRSLALSNLKIVGPTGYSFNGGIAVRKNQKILLSILNKVLGNISKNEIDKIYRKWVKVEVEEKIDYSIVWRVIVIALMILFAILFWNRKLKNEIEERINAQNRLAKSRDFISAIMNSQTDIIVVTDGTQIKEANKSFFKELKFKSLEEFIKKYKCICDLFDTSDDKYLFPERNGKKWIDEILENPLKTHKAKIFIDGKEHIFKVVATKVKNNAPLKTAVFHDITELEKLHKDLIVAKDKALTAAKHKSEFLANMSHEIRTPMNSVIGFTELLDKEITNHVQKDYLNSIKKGGNALLAIINDILDLSKIEAGKMDIKNESINPKNLIMEIESIFHSKLVSKNIDFSIEVCDSIPDFIIVDSIRLRQILFNLIGNAIKFTEEGSIKLKVDNLYKDIAKSKIDLSISIEDTGIGIDEKDLQNIFKAFEQQKQQDNKFGGTGLGLAICSKLVHIMNGKISVKSKKGEGSTFTVKLFDIPVSSVGEKIISQKLDYSKIVFEKATILVVDDIEENRRLVQASLKDFDFKIVMAENGKEALNILKNININLILMDLRMPVMDGYKAATFIKKDDILKNIPLIALTASVMDKDLLKVNKFGFDDYLRKPVILDDLIEKISQFLPYEFIVDRIEEETQNIGHVDSELLENLIDKLKGVLKDEWIEIKDKGDFLLIENFVNKLEKLQGYKDIPIFANYIKEIKVNIEAFDIEKVDFLMNSYENLIKKLTIINEELEDK